MATPIKTLLLLGASGDLASRLLLPALGQLLDAEPGRRDITLVGAGIEAWDQPTWLARVRGSLESAHVSAETIEAVLTRTEYHPAELTRAEDLDRLLHAGPPAPALYFALPPAVTVGACTALKELTLPAGTTLVLEKPFGTNAESAASLNDLLTDLVPEDRIHRVDHFLGRATVLNLLGIRFANRLLEPVWNREHIEEVEIVFDEQLTLENRARYYDSAGALMDMIQSHLLQILALVAMEPIAGVDSRDFRTAKASVLRACRLWNDDPTTAAKRARYTHGTIDGREVPDYTAEPGVDPARGTETLAELTVEIDNWRWAGVPFRLRSGKALRDRRKDVLVTFKPVPHLPSGLHGRAEPNRLRLSMGPDALALGMTVNGPGDPLDLESITLTTDLSPGRLMPYGEVLAGVLDGNSLLSVRGDTAVECWRIVDPVLQGWRQHLAPIDEYPAGSSGPESWERPARPGD